MIKKVYKWLQLASNGDIPKDSIIKMWLDEELNEFDEAKKSNDINQKNNAIIDALWITLNLAFYNGLTIKDLEKESKAVFKSNMSKFCKTEKEAIKSCKMYANGTHPNKLGVTIETYYLKVKDIYVIRKKNDNKILKSYLFQDC